MKRMSLILLLFFLSAFTTNTPDAFENLYYKGVEAIIQKNYSAALLYLDEAIRLQPERDSAYSLMGYSYYSLNKPLQAVDYCNIALKINPKNAYAFFVRGMAVHSIDMFSDSVFSDSLYKVVKRHKGNKEWILKNVKNRYYAPENGSGIYDYGTAINDITKAIQLDSSRVNYYSWRAHLNYWLEKPDKAEPDYNRCIEMEPNNAYHYMNRGVFYERFSSPSYAMDDYSKGILLDSTIAELYERRGKLYQDFYHFKSYACKDFKKAALLGRYIEGMEEYCKPNQLDSLYDYSSRIYKPNQCFCPRMEDVFDPTTDTIKEIEILPGSGYKQKMIDIKDSEKTTWEFEDGRVITISKKTKQRWLKEEEERRKKEPKP